MVKFTINIPQMLAYIPYMDPMGHEDIPIIPMTTRPLHCKFTVVTSFSGAVNTAASHRTGPTMEVNN